MRVTRLARVGLSAAALVLVLAACGEDDVTPASENGVDVHSPASGADVAAYFGAVASYRITDLEAALALAQPGSVAEQYAGFQLATAQAADDAGSPIPPSEAKEVDDGYRACGGTGDPASCVTWADIESSDGKIVSFTVNDESLDDRLTAGDGVAEAAGDLAEVTFLYSYKSVQNATANLFVALRVTTVSAGVSLDSSTARYQDPDGKESLASDPRGPSVVAPDSTVTIVIPFAGAEPGGLITMSLTDDDQSTVATAEISTGQARSASS